MCYLDQRVSSSLRGSEDVIFLSGPLLALSCLLEFLLGNTFSFIVFMSHSKQLSV